MQITPDWLEQWWLEDHLGTRPMWVEIDGQEHQIETVADLLKIADQDKNT